MNESILLSGVVGSTAYGLAHSGSDVDRLGVYTVPTVELHGLHHPEESKVTTNPDVTLHEAAKWCRLALSCNPTVMELVWLDNYEQTTPLGEELIAIRRTFLSRDRVRSAYLGYATAQFKKLTERQARGVDGFGTVPVNRTEKHARHMLRLLQQGVALHLTGQLPIRVDDPLRLRMDAAAIALHPEFGEAWIGKAESWFRTPGVLPREPDEATVEAWLRRVRAEHYTPLSAA